MIKKLESFTYFESDIVNEGNRFLLGNGHLGYRGTYEELGKEALVALNLLGVYDRRGDKWRESVNMPNPFLARIHYGNKEVSLRTEAPLNHHVSLDLEHAIYRREDEFETHWFTAERFLSSAMEELLADRIEVKAKRKGTYSIVFGIDLDIYDINGPHFAFKDVQNEEGYLHFHGRTNEGKDLYETLNYRFSKGEIKKLGEGLMSLRFELEENEILTLELVALVSEDKPVHGPSPSYEEAKSLHEGEFFKRYHFSRVELVGAEEKAQFALDYSIYHLCILGSKNYARGIPARGVSGQVYKGASFWDSEIFLVPFFTLTNPGVARNLLLYRVNTLEGAKAKAHEFGYEGAFYAWESQDDGLEACSKYNVTDPLTGEPIRTYFNEKQIHISADIPYAFEQYLLLTGDESLLMEGGLDVLIECARFFLSYSSIGKDQKYHIRDVIGPDEYHERIDDNAFTNYLAKHAVEVALRYMDPCHPLVPQFRDFVENVYLPFPNKDGVIEQFQGYFDLEKVTVKEVRSRLRNPQDYWGGKFGVATPTQVIKQADVVALLALRKDAFPAEIKKANFEYYYPITEHGSSLSASMYSLLALELGKYEESYAAFYKSASVDLRDDNKMFAGGVYIGGTHPASEGGAYMSAIYGFAGFSNKEPMKFTPRLCDKIKGVKFHFYYHGKPYFASVSNDKTEVIPDEI